MIKESLYRYRVDPVRVIDGDTIVVDVDLGFWIRMRETVRLSGIDTPEIYGVNATDEGQWVRLFVELWLRGVELRYQDIRSSGADPKAAIASLSSIAYSSPMYLHSKKYDERGKYGRALGVIYRGEDVVSLNERLILEGMSS